MTTPLVDWATARAAVTRALQRGAVLVVPLVLVNAFAIYGQAQWALDNLTDSLTVAALFAAAVESVGLFLAAEAHAALMAGDAALRLRLGSYAIACLVGALNYSHFAPDWGPNPKAVAFAGLSTISPWLWSIRSRSMHRAELRAQGLVDPRTVRFAMARWVLYPVLTLRAFRAAVWEGIVDPASAVALLDRTAPEPAPEQPAPAPAVEQRPEPSMVDTTEPVDAAPEKAPAPAKPTPRKPGARVVDPAEIRRLHAGGQGLTQAAIAEQLGCSTKTVSRHLQEPAPPLSVVRTERTGS